MQYRGSSIIEKIKIDNIEKPVYRIYYNLAVCFTICCL